MKYFLIILNICILGILTGCGKSLEIVSDIKNEPNYSSIPQYTGSNVFIEGSLYSGTYFSGVYVPIIISGEKLILSEIFSVIIPKDITRKEYIVQNSPVNSTPSENMYFYTNDEYKSFSFVLGKLIRPDTTYSDKDLCNVEYFDGFITKSENIKEIQGRNIYIYYSTLLVSAPDIEPVEVIDTQFCFVDNGMVYKFSASNYTHEYMNQIIDSLTFL